MSPRSYLFVPGTRCDLIPKALACGADAIIIDLEDAVPPEQKDTARHSVVEALVGLAPAPPRPQVWLRINVPGTPEAEADLVSVAHLVDGVRLPKVQTSDDVAWVATRVPHTPLIAAIETAVGLLHAADIAAHERVVRLAMGGVDLVHDLGCRDDPASLQYARSLLVVASRAAQLPGPINSVFPILDNETGLREHAATARDLGFTAQSLLSPRQVAPVHEIFSPDDDQVAWAERILTTFHRSAGTAARTDAGEFVDVAVARRAASILGSTVDGAISGPIS